MSRTARRSRLIDVLVMIALCLFRNSLVETKPVPGLTMASNRSARRASGFLTRVNALVSTMATATNLRRLRRLYNVTRLNSMYAAALRLTSRPTAAVLETRINTFVFTNLLRNFAALSWAATFSHLRRPAALLVLLTGLIFAIAIVTGNSGTIGLAALDIAPLFAIVGFAAATAAYVLAARSGLLESTFATFTNSTATALAALFGVRGMAAATALAGTGLGGNGGARFDPKHGNGGWFHATRGQHRHVTRSRGLGLLFGDHRTNSLRGTTLVAAAAAARANGDGGTSRGFSTNAGGRFAVGGNGGGIIARGSPTTAAGVTPGNGIALAATAAGGSGGNGTFNRII